MCSIVIFNADNVHPDPALDWTKFKAGHVIDVRDDDNFFWGTDVHSQDGPGLWQIVVLPGVAASDVISLAAGDPIPEPYAPYRLRVNSIDVETLITKSLDPLDNDVGMNADQSIVVGVDQLLVLRSIDPPPADGSAIGDDRTIG